MGLETVLVLQELAEAAMLEVPYVFEYVVARAPVRAAEKLVELLAAETKALRHWSKELHDLREVVIRLAVFA